MPPGWPPVVPGLWVAGPPRAGATTGCRWGGMSAVPGRQARLLSRAASTGAGLSPGAGCRPPGLAATGRRPVLPQPGHRAPEARPLASGRSRWRPATVPAHRASARCALRPARTCRLRHPPGRGAQPARTPQGCGAARRAPRCCTAVPGTAVLRRVRASVGYGSRACYRSATLAPPWSTTVGAALEQYHRGAARWYCSCSCGHPVQPWPVYRPRRAAPAALHRGLRRTGCRPAGTVAATPRPRTAAPGGSAATPAVGGLAWQPAPGTGAWRPCRPPLQRG